MHNIFIVFGTMLVIIPAWIAGMFFLIEKFSSEYVYPAYVAATGIVLLAIGYFTGG